MICRSVKSVAAKFCTRFAVKDEDLLRDANYNTVGLI
jgi:hypothetical protein